MSTSSIAAPPAAAAIRVLLVDDQRIVAAAVARLLAAEPDMTLECCTRGADALACAADFRPSVILQDLVMPDIDGLALVELYRSTPATADTPVIVLSAHEDAEIRDRAIAAGAVDYLIKLPRQGELVACLRHHVQTLSARRAVATGGDPEEVIDARVLAGLREVDPASAAAFVESVMDLFLVEAESHLATLRRAAASGDGASLRAAAHTLKGSAMTIGARRVASACAEMELVTEAVDASNIAARMTAIDLELRRVRDAFRREGARTAI
jgi:CheY-like chemotaxis protein/HPt (histidine-containing phosphotransfer) domain-containing protein